MSRHHGDSGIVLIYGSEAWFENLYRDKGGEAKAALADLERLARERDSTVGALTLRYVDNIEADLTEVKSNMIEVKTNVVEVKSNVIEVKSNVVEVKSNVVEIKRAQRGQEQLLLQLLSKTSREQAERRGGKGWSKVALDLCTDDINKRNRRHRPRADSGRKESRRSSAFPQSGLICIRSTERASKWNYGRHLPVDPQKNGV